MIPKVLALLLALTLATISLSTTSDDMQTYIIYMDPVKIKAISNPRKWYLSLLKSVTKKVTQEEAYEGDLKQSIPRLLYAYQNVFAGFSAKLSAKQLQYLREVDGFVYATKDEGFQLETTNSYGFLGLRQGQGLWSPSNLNKTRDVIIGILDTGIWPEHSSFHDARMPPIPPRWKGICEVGPNFTQQNCNAKLIGARIFLNAFEAAHGRLDPTIDIRSPRDTNGHGTHVASIATGNLVPNANLFRYANGTASGMANTARIAMYKVCWYYRPRPSLGHKSTCYTADVAAAIDQAVADGVDVLSQSIGGPNVSFYKDPGAIAAFGASRNGILFVTSAGNNGSNSKTVRKLAPWMMTVGASSIDRSFPANLTLGNGQTFEGPSLYEGTSITNVPLFRPNFGFGYCNHTLDPRQVRGKIVICLQGYNSPIEKGEVVQSAGGAGMILVTTRQVENQAAAHFLPALNVGVPEYQAIVSYMRSPSPQGPRASISFRGTRYGDRAPMVAAFSSRGPNPVEPHILKPDIIAPGVNILAAWPSNLAPSRLDSDKRRVQFNILSGTSMACPHISGIAALLKAHHRNWSPAMIKSAMMTTAYIVDNKNGSILDYNDTQPATPFTFGSGHVDPEKAADPGLVYDISKDDYLIYLCKLGYTPQQIMLFTGGLPFPCPSGKHEPDVNYPSFSVLLERNASTVTYQRTVTNVGTPQSIYTARVEAPLGVSVTVNPQTLRFQNLDQTLSFNVTFVSNGAATTGSASFGSLTWLFGNRYTVRSPIAVTWITSRNKFQDLLEPIIGEEDELFYRL